MMGQAFEEHRFGDVECRVSVETPEQIQLSFTLAGIGSRIAAYSIDLLIRVGVVFVLGLVVMAVTGSGAPEVGLGLGFVIYFIVDWAYHTVIEWAWNGYTPGKKLLGLRVVRTNGVSMDLLRSAIRNLLRAADAFPFAYATAFLVMFFTRSERRLGDFVADTMVIREDRARLRDLPPLPEGAEELSLSFGMPVAGLNQKDIALIEEFFRRHRYFTKDRASGFRPGTIRKPFWRPS
jgi:uncharacterized RDD family membrane protein YckC